MWNNMHREIAKKCEMPVFGKGDEDFGEYPNHVGAKGARNVKPLRDIFRLFEGT